MQNRAPPEPSIGSKSETRQGRSSRGRLAQCRQARRITRARERPDRDWGSPAYDGPRTNYSRNGGGRDAMRLARIAVEAQPQATYGGRCTDSTCTSGRPGLLAL